MDILMSGASGFIGRRLVDRWSGHRIFAVGRTPVPGTTHVHADLADGLADPSRLPEHVDVVVHLATSQSDPATIFRVNSAATLELLGAAIPRGATRFILASTGRVYGGRADDASEDTPPVGIDLYSYSKLMAEELVCAYASQLAPMVLRLYMPYGPGQTRRLFAELVSRIREGRPVTLVNGGEPVLNPIYIDDLLEVFDAALTRPPDPLLLNVGGSEALSVRHMAEHIGRALGVAPAFESVGRDGGPARLVGRIDRLCAWLGHPPRVGFAEGAARAVTAR